MLVPRGYHPVAAAARHDLYYLNVMAGPGAPLVHDRRPAVQLTGACVGQAPARVDLAVHLNVALLDREGMLERRCGVAELLRLFRGAESQERS